MIYDRKIIARHEAGHVIVARHFGMRSCGYIDDRGGKAATCRDDPKMTPFRNACISWAGVIAEDVEGLEEIEDLRFHFEFRYKQWMASGFATFDAPGANGHPQRWRAVKTAWAILRAKRAQLDEEAVLIDRGDSQA